MKQLACGALSLSTAVFPHLHTVGLTKKRVHDVDEVCKEDFSPAACLHV